VPPQGLSRRLPVALIGGPAVIALSGWGGIPFLLLVGVIALRGQWELVRLYAPERGLGVVRLVVLLVGAVLLTDAWLEGGQGWAWIMLAGTALLLGLQVFLPGGVATAGAVAGGCTSWLYVVLPLAHLIWLRGIPGPAGEITNGAGVVIALWLIVWAFDTTAYFVGSAWGRHKLIPAVSPAKSWEGTAGGFAAALLLGLAAAGLGGSGLGWSAGDGIGAGLLVGAGALLGDLVESRLKRGVGRKDAGTMLAGHGGVLDRFDSMLVCAPLLYWGAVLLGGLTRIL
jgi:phosphatidate cytidylyltransferase